MRGGVVPLVVVPLGVEHRHRVLRGRPGVQVNQGLVVPDGPGEDREVLPDRLDVEVIRVAIAHADTSANLS